MAPIARTTKDIIHICFFYILTRCFWLTRYPIFNDEAIYLFYGQVMIRQPNQLWFSLSHTGKQPLLYWLYGISMQLVSDPLLAGRIVTVLMGIATPIACYCIGRVTKSRSVGLIAAFFALASPLLLFFDRLALVDSTLAAIFSWILFLLVGFHKENSMQRAIALGVLVGMSLWIKSTGFLFALVCVLYLVRYGWQYIVPFGFTVFLIFLPLFIRPEYSHALMRASEYAYSIPEVFQNSFRHVPGNMLDALLIYIGFISPLSFIAIVKAPKNTLFFSWGIVCLITLLFGKFVHGRYLLFTSVPIFIFMAHLIAPKRWLLVLTSIPMVALSMLQIVNPPFFFHIFPRWRVFAGETQQYIDGWSSGYGVKEVVEAIEQDRKGQPAVVAIRWDSGNPESPLLVYYADTTDVEVKYLDGRLPEETASVLRSLSTTPVYFVTRKGQYGGFESILVPFAQFDKPSGQEKIEVFRVKHPL